MSADLDRTRSTPRLGERTLRASDGITRRRFVQGVIAGGVLAGLDLWKLPTLAAEIVGGPPAISGSHFDLIIGQVPVNFTGRPSFATAVNGSVPGPTLRWREGDTVRLSVTNRLKVPDLDSLARNQSARRYGRCSRSKFSRHRRWRDFYLLNPDQAARHLLVPQPQVSGQIRRQSRPVRARVGGSYEPPCLIQCLRSRNEPVPGDLLRPLRRGRPGYASA